MRPLLDTAWTIFSPRAFLLVAIYAAIIFNTKETVEKDEVPLIFYSLVVLLSGWALFSVANAVIELMMNTFGVMLKAVAIMIIGGLIAAPYYLFPVYGAPISYFLLVLLFIVPFVILPCVFAWGALQ